MRARRRGGAAAPGRLYLAVLSFSAFRRGVRHAGRHGDGLWPGLSTGAADPDADRRRADHRHGAALSSGCIGSGLLDRQMRHQWDRASRAGRWVGFCWDWRLPLAGRRASGRCWRPCCRWRPARDTAWEGGRVATGDLFAGAGRAVFPGRYRGRGHSPGLFPGFQDAILHTVERVMGVLLVITGVLFSDGQFQPAILLVPRNISRRWQISAEW